jgi:hypothetical protein
VGWAATRAARLAPVAVAGPLLRPCGPLCCRRLGVHQPRLHVVVLPKERLRVDDEIFEPAPGSQRLDLDLSAASRISPLQARRLRPLICIVCEPYTPCPHERREVNVPPGYHVMAFKPSHTRSIGSAGSWYACRWGGASLSGSNRRHRKVTGIGAASRAWTDAGRDTLAY